MLKNLTPIASNQTGSAALLVALTVCSLFAVTGLIVRRQTESKISLIHQELRKEDSFYAGEIAVLSHWKLKKASPNAPQARNLTMNNNMDHLLSGGSKISSTSGTSYLSTTRQYDSGKTLMRSYYGGNLVSENIAATGTQSEKICGKLSFAGANVPSPTCLKVATLTVPPLCSRTDLPGGLCRNEMTCPACALGKPVTLIHNQAELQAMTSCGNYRLANDITLDSSFKPISSGNIWSPDASFDQSVLDGAGFTIRNLDLHVQTDNYTKAYGLFSVVTRSVIGNLKIDNLNISYDVAGSVGNSVGGLAGIVSDSCLESISVTNGTFSSTRGGNVGGLVGENGDWSNGVFPTNGGLIVHNSSTSVNISGPTIAAIPIRFGGLIGGGDGARQSSDPSTILSVSDSYATGNISVNGPPGSQANIAIGGLIGIVEYKARIERSYATGNVADLTTPTLGFFYGSTIGGLVGVIWAQENDWVLINQSYALGDVSSNVANWVGGLIGWGMYSAITNSYARGRVTSNLLQGTNGGYCVGGLAGSLLNNPANNFAQVINSYATGRVLNYGGSANYTGGLVGCNNLMVSTPAVVYTNSYWNRTVWNAATSVINGGPPTSAGGTAKTTLQMQTQSTYVGWDFINIWEMPAGGGYPVLRTTP